ncbi:MAG: hypothetical protein Q9167_007133 [Letrouitia subvulpina]
MVFLGTPFRGSRHAKWANTLQNIVHIFTETNTKKLRDLQVDSEKLKVLVETFPDILRKRDIEGPRIAVTFFIETLKYKGIHVVTEDSAWIPGCGDHASIRADHLSICKFKAKEEDGYQAILGALQKAAQMGSEYKEPLGFGSTFHNYGDVKNQIGRDQNITGDLIFN